MECEFTVWSFQVFLLAQQFTSQVLGRFVWFSSQDWKIKGNVFIYNFLCNKITWPVRNLVQIYTLKHEITNVQSLMPGLIMAIRKVVRLKVSFLILFQLCCISLSSRKTYICCQLLRNFFHNCVLIRYCTFPLGRISCMAWRSSCKGSKFYRTTSGAIGQISLF